jgi:hypothetical protein
MKTTLSIAVGVLLCSVSVAQATPIRGFFTGSVTFNSNQDPLSELAVPVGTLVSAIFAYDTDYLSAPDAFGNRSIYYSPPDVIGFFLVEIPAGDPLVGYTFSGGGNSLGLIVDAAGLPVGGGGLGYFDLSIGPSGFAVSEIDGSALLTAEGTYSLSDHESTLPLTVIGLAALAVARRFLL